jgi:hypothetical protein
MPSARDVILDSDARTFAADHPHPALVFVAVRGKAAASGRARKKSTARVSDGETELSTSLDLEASPPARSRLGLLVRADSRLEWLTKREPDARAPGVNVGRDDGNDVIVAVASVSRLHAIFTLEQSGWGIMDPASTNGTFLEGVRLPRFKRRLVADGAEVAFGRDVIAHFVLPESLGKLLGVVRRPVTR